MKQILFKRMATALVIALIVITGCKKEDQGDEIDDLQRRVASLEELSNQLKQKVDASYLVKSVESLTGGRWKIEFTSGDPIEVSNIAGKTGGGVVMVEIIDGYRVINGVKTTTKATSEKGAPQ